MTVAVRRLAFAVLTLLLAPGFVLSAAAATSITVQWDANPEPDITNYIVSYGTQHGVYNQQVVVGKTTSTVISLPSTGTYYFVVYAVSPQGTSDPSAEVSTTILPSTPFIDLDTPREGYVTTSAFEVGGWALDAAAGSGTGVDAVVFYVFPNNGTSPGVYIGQGSYGWTRTDVGALFGSQFNNSGFHFTITGLGPGTFMLGVYARSTVTGGFTIVKTVHFTVNANALMGVSPPQAEAVITSNIINVDGWALDRAIESTALSGPGVDMLHVYAYPYSASGNGPAIFLGVASMGLYRPDVAALYGSRYSTSGFHLAVDRSALGLAPGAYNIVVHAHSTVAGTFNNAAVVRVILQ